MYDGRDSSNRFHVFDFCPFKAMRNLPTPLYEPILPDPETEKKLGFWKRELEKMCSKHILNWSFKVFGSDLAFASSWNKEDGVIFSFLERMLCRLPSMELIHYLLLPEIWTPLEPEDAEAKTFDGRKADEALWDRYDIECLCKRNEAVVKRYRAWIVPTLRVENPALADMPVLSWVERFGVLRIAPLARWRKNSVDAYLNRDFKMYDPFFHPRREKEKSAVLHEESYSDSPLKEMEQNVSLVE